MNPKKLAITIAVTLGIVLACQLSLSAQEPAKHHHYKLIEQGTFGGPASYLDPDNGFDIGTSSPLLNNGGTVTGFADTTTPDPFAPNSCFADCFVTHVFQWQNGVLTDLGALPGGGSSASTWITPNGLIAGLSENGELDPLFSGLPEAHAVLWQNGNITDLGTLPEGGYESEANAVNSRGQVVGAALNSVPDANSMALGTFWLAEVPYGYQTRAFIWEKGKMQDLGTLGTGTDAQAISINEEGRVVGWSYISSAPSPLCTTGFLTTDSFIWDMEKGMKDLGGLGGTCTLAQDLNNQGQIVGISNLTGDTMEHAFLWEHGSIQDLGGSLGGDYTGAFMVNDVGKAVGYAYLTGDATYHAALWRHVGDMTDLGVLGKDTCSIASSINAKTQVVGASSPRCDFDNARALLWEDDSLSNLNALVPYHPGLLLRKAENINDRGEIAGTGVDPSGNEHAFLLIPCDENHPDVEGCDYSLVDATAAADADPAQDPNSPAPTANDTKLSPIDVMARFRSVRARRDRRYETRQTSPQ
jgi:probable HAF family extracellular repeat protein